MNNGLSKQDKQIVDNDIYDQLGEKWYEAGDDPVALLRAQQKFITPWILGEVRKNIGYHAEILDVGCGAGFFSNEAAKGEYKITGIDISNSSLKVAEMHDSTKSVQYLYGDAYKIPFPRESFDVAIALDLLEHVSEPQKVLNEISRVLRPGGLMFFHTFNRNLLSYLFVIEGMKIFIKNTPEDLHVYSLFRKPKEIEDWIDDAGMDLKILRGIAPIIFQKNFWKMLWTREVPEDFCFRWTKSHLISFVGYAKKLREQ